MIGRPRRSTLFPYTPLFRSISVMGGMSKYTPKYKGGAMLLPPASRMRSRGTRTTVRSEEHTSELQSRPHLVCRLLLETKNQLVGSRRRRALYLGRIADIVAQ